MNIKSKLEEILESGSGSEHMMEGASANEEDAADQHPKNNKKKKRYHRHTTRQIQEMEAYVLTNIITLSLSL